MYPFYSAVVSVSTKCIFWKGSRQCVTSRCQDSRRERRAGAPKARVLLVYPFMAFNRVCFLSHLRSTLPRGLASYSLVRCRSIATTVVLNLHR